MERATPVQLRKCAEAADAMIKAGIRFVPVPVFSDEEQQAAIDLADAAFDKVLS